MSEPDPWCRATAHGTPNAYRHAGCRCDAGRHAAAKAHNVWKLAVADGHLLVPVIGTCRRIQALGTQGWSVPALASMLPDEPPRHVVGRWLWDADSRLRRGYARDMADLYDKLEFTPGPSRHSANRAAAKGWPGPERWFGVDMDDPSAVALPNFGHMGYFSVDIDEVVVARLVAGDLWPGKPNRHERREATRVLWELGLTTSEISVRCGWDDRIVSRDVAWLFERGLAASRGRAVARVVECETVVLDRARPPRL